tara:strand:- start:159 stop:353 length:195 start_codon:yes stop_codon:yes gene_type:complete
MSDIQRIIRDFQAKKKVPLSHIAESIGRHRDFFYKLYSRNSVLKEQDKKKLNELFESYNYEVRI